MYTRINFKTKKALKEAIAAGQSVKVFSPGPFPPALPKAQLHSKGHTTQSLINGTLRHS